MKPEDVVLETAPVLEEAPTGGVEAPVTAVAGAVGAAVDGATSIPGEEEGTSDQPPGDSATNDDPSDPEKQRPASPQMKAPHISTVYNKQVGQASVTIPSFNFRRTWLLCFVGASRFCLYEKPNTSEELVVRLFMFRKAITPCAGILFAAST